MKQYVDLILKTLKEGQYKSDRTGTGTKSIFGHQSEYDLREGFPLLTLKRTHWKSIVHENLWFLQGGTNTKYLKENGVTIWDEWADEKGDLGPVYGKQWVDWGGYEIVNGEEIEGLNEGINQMQKAINTLKTNPDDRGNIVSAWNVGELHKMALRPCHAFFQFYSVEINTKERYELFDRWSKEKRLDLSGMSIETAMEHYKFPSRYVDLQLYQRSADIFLGVPFNIAGYSLLLSMVAQVVNMVPRKFVHSFGDAHIYSNHKEQVNKFLFRTISHSFPGNVSEQEHEDNSDIPNYFDNPNLYDREIEEKGSFYGLGLPQLKLNTEIKDIFDFKFEDIEIMDYHSLSTIKAPVAV
jgi:thymidylate synthase